jgi:hypothetical protein
MGDRGGSSRSGGGGNGTNNSNQVKTPNRYVPSVRECLKSSELEIRSSPYDC